MTLFRKIKSITVGQLTTRYCVELTCPRCNHFADQVIEITPPTVFNLTAVTWELPHFCDIEKEKSILNAESKYSRRAVTALTAGKRRA